MMRLSPFLCERRSGFKAGLNTSKNQFAEDVRAGLDQPQKALPPKYLYDAVGSALFDAITEMPEYGLTRADERLLHRHAEEIAALCCPISRVVELGSGSGRKTRPMLQAVLDYQSETVYSAIDVSDAALERCRRELSDMPGLGIEIHKQTYLEGIRSIAEQDRDSFPLLVLFLGSSIANFDRHEAILFLRDLRDLLRPGDALLIGADLVKPIGHLLLAYDDPAGVTAAFNKNLLGRINRELGGDFDPWLFEHEARWSSEERRIEMHLCALTECRVRIPEAGYEGRFREGETIWTESSYKFRPAELKSMASDAGFMPYRQWIDSQWPFAECLWIVPE